MQSLLNVFHVKPEMVGADNTGRGQYVKYNSLKTKEELLMVYNAKTWIREAYNKRIHARQGKEMLLYLLFSKITVNYVFVSQV